VVGLGAVGGSGRLEPGSDGSALDDCGLGDSAVGDSAVGASEAAVSGVAGSAEAEGDSNTVDWDVALLWG